MADLFTGMYATVAILAALRHAEHTGVGQHVDMALLDAQVAMLANLGANYLVSGNVPGRAGNAHQNIVPYQVFEVAPAADGHKDHMILAVGNDGQYAKFCEVALRPELASDPRFARNQDRVRNRAMLVPMLEAIMKARTKAQWLSALEAAKVPCGAINSIAEVFADPQVQRARHGDAVVASAAARAAPGVQPDQAERDAGAHRPAAAAAGPAHRRGAARTARLR